MRWLPIAAIWVGLAVAANWWIVVRPLGRADAAAEADRAAQDALTGHYESASMSRHPTSVSCACGAYQGLKPAQAAWTATVVHERHRCMPSREVLR